MKNKKQKTARIPPTRQKTSPLKQTKAKPGSAPGKPASRFATEKLNRAISQLLSKRNFKNMKEAEKFIQDLVIGKDLDQILSSCDFDPAEEAQNLAYEAMDTENPIEALNLAQEALRLDPSCIDALMIQAKYTSRSLFDMIEKVKMISAIGEKNLGKEFFEENTGHFWNMVETRPYMRCLAFLAGALRETGQTAEAIRQCEEMLKLNPNDNQGLRDTLLGLYLETGNLEGARRLFKQYPGEYLALFLWGQVLERFLSGDTQKAAEICKKAQKRNPYVKDYLTGKKQPPREPLDHFAPGEESEAVVCFEEIGAAWKKHSEAVAWLKLLK